MKKYLSLVFLFLALIAPSAPAEEKRNLTVEDLTAIRHVSDPQLSPDGKDIAYVVKTLNVKNDKTYTDIYLIPSMGGEEIQLTSDEFDSAHPDSSPSPRWSPDNKYLAYLAKRDKKPQLFIFKRIGGVSRQLTDVKQYVSAYEWAPDGKKLALVMTDVDPNEPDPEKDKDKTPLPIVVTRIQTKRDTSGFLNDFRDHIYVFDLDTKDLKQITSGAWDDSNPRWSPDSSKILFVSNRSENADTNRNTDLYVVPASGGEAKQLTTNPGPDTEPAWSPDGKWIAYTTSTHPDLIYYDSRDLAIIPSTGGEPKVLSTQLDRNCYYPKFSPDGKRVYFLLEDQGTQRLASISISGSDVNRKESTENVLSDYNVTPNGLVYLASRWNQPDEVFASVGSGKTQLQITRVNQKLLSQLNLGTVEPVQFKSKDGTPVSGFVVKPPGFDPSKKYPFINWIHGGPTSQYTDEFEFTRQLFAANGYVVLLVNYRGSTGYGREFCKSILADWGNKEIDDLTAGIDFMLAQGFVDPERLGVGGWSYGGILTDWSIVKSSRFKAAASGAGMGNALAGYGTDHYQYEYEKELGFPWEHLDKWLKVSVPFLKLNEIKTPTLFMCGEKDWNVPLINSEQMYQGLRRLGIDTMLIIYPGERHSISKPSYLKDRYLRYLAWYGHYLKGEPDKTPPLPKKEESKN